VLGKALGTGVVTTGIKSGDAPPEAVEATVASMRQLNRDAAEILEEFEVHAATDVTGFGLMGHLSEMCRASGVGARVWGRAPRLLPGALELAEAGCVPGGTGRNRRALAETVSWDEGLEEALRVLLSDAQTSGGLLAAVPADRAEALAGAWAGAGYAPAVVGELVESPEAKIRVEDR
jgi:selenide,water dikinase